MTRDGLIAAPRGVVAGGVRRIAGVLTVASFTVLVAGSGLVDLLFPVALPKLVGTERQAEEQLRKDAHLADGSLARLVERDVRLTSRVRDTVSPWYTYALYRWLGVGRGSVYIGSRGWLFTKARVRVRSQPDHVVVGFASGVAATVNRRLAALGVDLIVAPIPRKSVVAQARLPPGIDPRPNLYPQYLARARNLGVRNADLLSAFRGVGLESTFYKADTHWNDKGMFVAAEEIAREAGLWLEKEQRRTQVYEVKEHRRPMDQLRFLGISPKVLAHVGQSGVGYSVHDPRGRRVEPIPVGKAAKVGLIGTSYSRPNFARYLTHFSGQGIQRRVLPGGGPTAALSQLLREGKKNGLPETLIWEIPTHYFFWLRPKLGFARWFGEFPPSRVRAHPPGDWLRGITPAALPRQVRLTRRWKRVAAIRAGHFVHSGDGAVGLRLRGQIDRGSVAVESVSDSLNVQVLWRKGRGEIVVPILGHRPVHGSMVRMRIARGKPRLRIDGIDLVDDLDPKAGMGARLSGVRGTSDGWQQTADFIEPVKIETGATLEVRLDVQGPFDGSLVLEARPPTDFDCDCRWTFDRVGPESVILMNLGPLYGEKLSSIVLQGSGPPPRRAAQAVAVLPLARDDAPRPGR